MRRVVAALLAALPFDPRSRRALDETLLDWAYEVASAGSALGRVATGLRALFAIARALVWAVSWEVVHVPYGWLATRMAVSAGLPAAAFMWLAYRGISELRSLASPLVGIELSALLVPHEVEVLLPLTFLFAIGWSGHRRASAIGLALVASAATLLFCLWIEPAAYDRFQRTANVIWQPARPHSSYGSAGRPPSEVVRAMRDSAHLVFGFLAFKLALSGLAGALAWLASVGPFRGGSWRRAGLLIAAPVFYIGALKALTGGYVPNYYYVTESGAASWCAWALAVVAAAVFIRATRGRRWLLLAPVVFVSVGKVTLPDDWQFLYRAYTTGVAPWLMALVVIAIAARLARRGDSTGLESNA